MNTEFPSVIAESLKEPFEKILSTENFGDTVNGIAELIYEGKLNTVTLDNLLLKNGVKRIESQKIELLKLILSYVELILEDNCITHTEAENVKYLKLMFKIQEGDFYHNKYYEIERVLDKQFGHMYQNNSIDEEEALQKVELQELFNLGYDQFLVLSKKAVKAAIERGADPKDLDTFIKIS